MCDLTVIVTSTSKVKQHTYRTARVRNHVLAFDRQQVKPLEERLAEAAGAKPDNHTVYEITNGDRKVYVSCSDNTTIVGLDIRVKNW